MGLLHVLPFETLWHQVRLVGVHDEVELIDEVLGLDEALQSANHRHLAIFQHDHGQEWVGVLPQGLRHCNTKQRWSIQLLDITETLFAKK